MSFRWRLGDYVGGDTAVHQGYKPFLCLKPDVYAAGEFQIYARDYSDIVISGLGFEPDVVMLISYRPKYANGGSDSAYGSRGGGMTFGVQGADAQFTGSSRIRHAFEPNISYWNEDCCFRVAHDFGATEVLKLTCALDSDGFTLTPVVNLYDADDYIAWIAMSFSKKCRVGVMTTGDTLIDSIPGRPQGATFLSTKHTSGVSYRDGYWDHMQGFASYDGNVACIWGGCQPTSWNWTTERWQDDAAIVLCTPASGSSFAGASYDVGGIVSDWWEDTDSVSIVRSGTTATVTHTTHGFSSGTLVLISGANEYQYNGVQEITVSDPDTYTYTVTGSPATPATGNPKATVGGLDLQWPVYGNQLYRVGYIVVASDPDSKVLAEAGVLETSWETRPGGTYNIPGTGENLQTTTMLSPEVILMAATNYNFSWSDSDPYNLPRSPDQFGFGGSGGLGWHFAPFSVYGYDAYGVHTFGNAVAEIGHYSNSGTQYMRRWILAGQGSNSNPPAYHQHSVNVVPNPMIPGLNRRWAMRNSHNPRLLINQSGH